MRCTFAHLALKSDRVFGFKGHPYLPGKKLHKKVQALL
jgi:hypothetical protein